MVGRLWLAAMVTVQIGVFVIGVANAADEPVSDKVTWSEAVPKAVLATEFFVSPEGKETNAGTMAEPWDLKSVLEGKHAFDQGGVVWMRGGTYSAETLESKLKGAPGAPVILRQYPGERATIVGRLMIMGGDNAWYWGFELTHANPSRTTGGGALDVYNAPNVKLINLTVHDTNGVGIGCWVGALNAEVSGCVVYYNGYQGGGGDRGHCHGIYTQNKEGTKLLNGNIIFDQFSYGIHAYTEKGFVEGYDVEGNICFNNGAISRDGQNAGNMIFVAGENTMRRISVRDNYTYHTPSKNKGSVQLDWRGGGPHEDITAANNYWIGGGVAVEVWNWNKVTFAGNTAYSERGIVTCLGANPDQKMSEYAWDNNTYYGSGTFRLNGKDVNWDEWRKQTEFDAHSRFKAGRPKGEWVFVRPNKYEPGRGNICIYNWDMKDAVKADLSPVLKNGAAYEIRDVENFFGPAVATGVYNGTDVSIPMKGLIVATPKGDVPTPPTHTAPEFGAFVVVSKGTE